VSRVLIVSSDRSYGPGLPANIGDAFLTDALRQRLISLGHDVRAVDFGGDRTVDGSSRVTLRGFRELTTAVRQSDVVVLGGGTLIQEDENRRLIGGLARLSLAVRVACLLSKRRLAYFGVGVDPLTRLSTRLVYWLATRRTRVWVRDRRSSDRFSRYFRFEPGVAADTALLWKQVQETLGAAPGPSASIVLAPNHNHGSDISTDVVEAISAADREVVLISMSQTPGNADHEAVHSAARAATQVVHGIGWREALEQIGSVQAVVASRMHALYMAMLSGRPMVAVGSGAKIRSFAEEFGVPLISRYAEYVPGVERYANGMAMSAAVDRADASAAELDAWIRQES
jgi:polysaccharide pyruvyl transferase WcaK-like protein